ncbi:MAG: L,D-transpeptidase family protein [Halioglobus sp.]|nr:L,D-transpeptidase family protein [Halioglobus sp.]
MRVCISLLTLFPAILASAATFEFPPAEFDVFGAVQFVEAAQEETLLDIARRHDIGQEEILRANPEVDRWLPGAGARVVLPSRYVMPTAPHQGLILNLPEMRLYYFPEPGPGQQREVQTYPVSIGRMEWSTPLGETKLVSKQQNPSWRPPESIRAEHAADGDPLPRVVPPGPDNPLGAYAMRLGIPGYLIHSTNKTYGVGMRVSHGCIRMLPEDIEWLFPQVPVGTAVRIINQPAKVGWHGGDLYLEVHPPLEEERMSAAALREQAMLEIDRALFRRFGDIDAAAVERTLREQSGIPTVISR